MEMQARRKALLIVNFGLQPSEIDNLTVLEVNTLYEVLEEANKS
jgi:uncharacterized protein